MGELIREGLRRPYTKEMGELLAQGLIKPHEKDEQRIYEEKQLHSLANVQTHLILRRLDPQRKRLLLQFLSQSGLIEREAPIVNLGEADLRNAILCEYHAMDRTTASLFLRNDTDPSKYLSKDDLSDVLKKIDAYLDDFLAILEDTRTRAVLDWTDLRGVLMMKAYLRSAYLRSADLSGAFPFRGRPNRC